MIVEPTRDMLIFALRAHAKGDGAVARTYHLTPDGPVALTGPEAFAAAADLLEADGRAREPVKAENCPCGRSGWEKGLGGIRTWVTEASDVEDGCCNEPFCPGCGAQLKEDGYIIKFREAD